MFLIKCGKTICQESSCSFSKVLLKRFGLCMCLSRGKISLEKSLELDWGSSVDPSNLVSMITPPSRIPVKSLISTGTNLMGWCQCWPCWAALGTNRSLNQEAEGWAVWDVILSSGELEDWLGKCTGLSPAGWRGNKNRSYVGSPWPHASCFSHKRSTVREILELGYWGNSSCDVKCLQVS